MGFFIQTLLIGIGLSMDAFAVSICKGLGMSKLNKKQMLIIALYFGGFQALMPFLGWAVGARFSSYVSQYAHWIAFILLAVIGGKMMHEALTESEDCENSDEKDKKLSHKELLFLAIATSIDALAVGISFAFLNVPIMPSITIIGFTTFFISLTGIAIGNIFGSKYKNKAEFVGGLILVAIGLKIILEQYLIVV
ncbi:MAG: manganese efflux pump MntP family protein [bacterium]|nr:manganese efflux pump MntP family protein [bacterium]